MIQETILPTFDLLASFDLSLLAQSEVSFLGNIVGQLSAFVKVAIGIGLVIFVHELGHFAAAKLFGVKCEKFYIGFDVPLPKIGPIQLPSTLGKFRYGETEYGIGILPLGGYVKMLGQDDDPRELAKTAREAEAAKHGLAPEDAGSGNGEVAQMISDGPLPSSHDDQPVTPATPLDPRSYQAQPVWQRMIIISAGVVMNVITGFLFAALAYGFGVPETPSLVGHVVPGGPAWQAGMEPGGRVVAVGRKEDPQMSFRKMQMEILTAGLRDSSVPVPVELDYGNRKQAFDLKLLSHPAEKDLRMIGIATPQGGKLSKSQPTIFGSVAESVIKPEDGGSKIIAFNETAIINDSLSPTTIFDNALYSQPKQPIKLTLQKTDEKGQTTDRVVALPPQTAKTFGVSYTVGAIEVIADNSAAQRAGLKIGDTIVSVDENAVGDPFDLAVELVSRETPVQLSVARGSGQNAEVLDVTLEPRLGNQTGSPLGSVTGLMAINSIGIAYRPEPIISETSIDGLQIGDVLQKVKLTTPVNQLPEYLSSRDQEGSSVRQLIDGWQFSPKHPLIVFDTVVQALPVGAELEILVARGDDAQIVTANSVVAEDPAAFRFERGLVRPAKEYLHVADGPVDALRLGLGEGVERFTEVTDFLNMARKGQLKMRHVGGPLSIFAVAKSESEAGISRLLIFLTLLSMNLAILNFLPIPVLDGGHMVFLTYELVTGRRPNERVQYILQMVGMLFLIALMIIVFTQDIRRFSGY